VDPKEVAEFLRGLPLAMDPGFARFVLGFPHKYLAETPRAEVVKHYALAGSLGSKPVISSLARAAERAWKLCVVTRDRRFLFSRIAGALSCFGMDIVSAEAFANAGAVVLDTFHFRDGEGRFDEDALRRRFQVFLEEALEGSVDLDQQLQARLGPQGLPPLAGLEVALEDEDELALGATRLLLRGPDCFALLYRVSRRLSEAGADIQQAEIETSAGRVRDEFLLTRDGRPLAEEGRREVERALAAFR
jgi:UTP:GlnB (protein PII) uridylyltransferase